MHSDSIISGGRPVSRAVRLKVGAGAAALLLTGSLLGWSASAIGAGPGSGPAASPAPASGSASRERVIPTAGDSYAEIVEQVAPAVVTIRSERRVRTTSSPFPDDPLFRQFFGSPRAPRERREGGLGSGVLVRPDGYVLTNEHVVRGAETVTVELTDGRTFDAKVIGSDPPSDLAVVKIDGTNLQTLPLGDSDSVRVGDIALAIGNPLNVGQTVTMGIISGKGRATGARNDSYEDFIQTDAPINEGNSGGALVNSRGELIGINSQILTPSGGNIGIGFAIPANMAKNVMTQLIDHGDVRRGLLGVTVQPVTSEIARSLGIDSARGALVNSVDSGGAAARAGIRRGDVITAVNGQPVRDSNTLRNEIAQLMPGTETRLAVVRDGKEQSYSVTLGERKAERSETNAEAAGPGTDGYGLTIEPLTREQANQLGVTATSGVVVVDVQPSSRAARAGIRPGDVIEEVNRTKVASADALRSALAKAAGRPALLLVHRGEATVYLTLE